MHLIRHQATMTCCNKHKRPRKHCWRAKYGDEMATGLYAIYDTVAKYILSDVITIFKHEAPAVRMFTDLLSGNKGAIAQHPADHQLVRLGWINDDLTIQAEYAVILDGKAWLAMQPETITAEVNRNSDLGEHFASQQRNDNQSAQRRALEARR